MKGISDLADKLIQEAIQVDGEVDRNSIAQRLLEQCDEEYRHTFEFEGAARLISQRLRKVSVSVVAERFSLQPELFGKDMHGMYPVDGEDGRRWKAVPRVYEMEAYQIQDRFAAQRRAVENHEKQWDALIRTARPVWRHHPDIDLGTALEMASRNGGWRAAQ